VIVFLLHERHCGLLACGKLCSNSVMIQQRWWCVHQLSVGRPCHAQQVLVILVFLVMHEVHEGLAGHVGHVGRGSWRVSGNRNI
jgi:hypothetical protein